MAVRWLSAEKARCKLPAREIVPVAATRSEVVARMEKLLIEPLARLRFPEAPATLRALLPALPGAKVPPDWMVVVGRVPVPPMVPPELTVTPEELAIEPSTKSLAPLAMVVAPV